MKLRTRLTEKLGIEHPILAAPMAGASGGALAAAVSRAGGLGLIGGGYGDAGFIETAFRDAGNTRVGCGFITWSMAKNPALLDLALSHRPAAMMLSFGDPAPFAGKIRDAGAVLICQTQNLDHVRAALDCGAAIIVAQGSEAGGHGAVRGTMSFVPEVADHLAAHAPDVLLLAAGGIADGRGLAASLQLGADGVLVGTRFWAAEESLAPRGHREAGVAANGDASLRTSVVDVIRQLDWPPGFTIRVGRNAFTDRWHGRDAALRAELDEEVPRYQAALASGDAVNSAPVFGEAAGLIRTIEPAGAIVAGMIEEAVAVLRRNNPVA
jgi:nitronate monooxygenase